ncbi:MAG: DNA-binding HxlR family transcriptional regulator [Myxococcota bacterium]|jgi:DNA-binding HxlR family transcriptional regulator
MTTERKCYGQLCPMATALDVVGERWTLLLLRELLGGPARFNALLDGLPGIPRNLLATRLRRLEHDGVVRRVSTGGTAQYALTEHGAAIRPTLEALGFWGARQQRVGPAVHPRSIRAIAMALQAVLARSPSACAAEPTEVELAVEGETVEIHLGPRPTAAARSSMGARARLAVTAETMADYLAGRPVDSATFELRSGDASARAVLLDALSVQTDGQSC